MYLLEAPSIDETTPLEEVVCLAQTGQNAALGELVRRFERTVQAIAWRRLGDHAEAEELCQDVFMHVMKKIGQLRDPICFPAWLRSLAHRMAINRALRRRHPLPAEPESLEGECMVRDDPLSTMLGQEQRSQVHVGLRRLGPLDRDTLVAFYFEGQSLKEMSEGFDSPVGTIKRRLHVARKRLQRELEELAVC